MNVFLGGVVFDDCSFKIVTSHIEYLKQCLKAQQFFEVYGGCDRVLLSS